jgi:hypothetical protein
MLNDFLTVATARGQLPAQVFGAALSRFAAQRFFDVIGAFFGQVALADRVQKQRPQPQQVGGKA